MPDMRTSKSTERSCFTSSDECERSLYRRSIGDEPSQAPVQPLVREPLQYEGDAAKLREYYLQEVCQTTRKVFADLLEEKKQLSTRRQKLDESIPGTFVYKDLAKPRDSFVMMRGAYDKPGDAVSRMCLPCFRRCLSAKATHGLHVWT